MFENRDFKLVYNLRNGGILGGVYSAIDVSGCATYIWDDSLQKMISKNDSYYVAVLTDGSKHRFPLDFNSVMDDFRNKITGADEMMVSTCNIKDVDEFVNYITHKQQV